MPNINIPISVLNLGPIREGESEKDAIDAMVRLAQATENMGYERYWIAEHHNTSSLISSATSMLIKHVLENTKEMKIGSGGVMLPNHSPLVVAEQFGTMAQIYPGRVDLGLGRAPGTDMFTASALRRSQDGDSVHSFPNDIQELLKYFGPMDVQGHVKAHIAIGTNVPIYVLGSSPNSAYLAAELGLPYAFAAHFAPKYMDEAIEIYKNKFKPSAYLDEPYMMVCLNVIATDDLEDAKKEMTTTQQLFLNIVRGTNNLLQPPKDDMDSLWNPQEKAAVLATTEVTLLGDKAAIREQLIDFQTKYKVDEIMAVSYIFDEEKQKRSYEIFKEVVSE